MKIVVTGSSGFIGGRLVADLVERGEHEVIAVMRDPSKSEGTLSAIRGDLSDPRWNPAEALPEKVDAILHLAQSRAYREFPDQAEDIFHVNTSATFRLLEYGRKAGASHFVYASSGSVYAGLDVNPLPESALISPGNFGDSPMGFYCASKVCAETLVESYRSHFQSVTSARIFAPYGPGGDSSLINRIAEKVASGKTVEIQGNPGLKLNPIHVDDLVSVLRKLLEFDESLGALNVAGEEVISLTDLVRICNEASKSPVQIEYSSCDPPEGSKLVADITKLKNKLSFKFTVPLREGIRSLIE